MKISFSAQKEKWGTDELILSVLKRGRMNHNKVEGTHPTFALVLEGKPQP